MTETATKTPPLPEDVKPHRHQSIVVTVIGWLFTLLSALPFVPSAIMKLTENEQAVKGFAQFGFPANSLVPIGVAEAVSLVLYLFPKTAVLGAILLTGYLGGAICTHVHAGDEFVIPAIIGVVVWLGIFFREPRLRAILPWRCSW